MKFLISFLALAGSCVYVLIFHSVTKLSFECRSAETLTRTGFLELEIYRPWIVWAESNGLAFFETPSGFFVFFENIKLGEREIHLYRRELEDGLDGSLSRLSGHLLITEPAPGFSGTCQQKKSLV